MPTISVVMAIHNGATFLSEAVDSILRQSFRDFELIAIDDASSDGSAELLLGIKDNRMRTITNKKQLGLSRSLNKGLAAARGQYVARMDHDDISLPGRLKAQIDFLEANPRIDVLGTWARTLGLHREQTWDYPTSDSEIRAEMLFNSVLVHSSVILRRSSFAKYKLRYDPNVARAQDYELWTRGAQHLRFANLGKALLRYRIHPQQVGQKHGSHQQAVAAKVRARQLKALGLQPSQAEFKLHNSISQWRFPASRAGLLEVESWLSTIRDANSKIRLYDAKGLDAVLERRWWAACRAAVSLGKPAWELYKRSSLASKGPRSATDKAVFWSKALLREGSQE